MIKRERYKGKYYLTARENGRIRSRIRWNKKQSKEEMVIRYQKQGSFHENIRSSFCGKNVFQVVVSGKKIKNKFSVSKPNRQYQYFVEAKDKSGAKYLGTSRLYPKDYPKETAREEAIANMLRRNALGETDDDERKIEDFTIINEGVIYYSRK